DSPAPAQASRFVIARANPAVGDQLMIAGFGYSGSDCTIDRSGNLNYGYASVAGFDGWDSAPSSMFFGQVWCEGDSGGPLLSLDGTASPRLQQGVISSEFWGAAHAASTAAHYSWIMSFVVAKPQSDILWRCVNGTGCGAAPAGST